MKLPYRFEIRSWTNNVNSDWVEMVHEPWLCDSVNKNGTAFSARIWIERNSFLKSSLWMCCFWVRRHTVFFFIFGHIFVSGFSFIRFKFLRSINNINTDAVNYIVSSIYTTHRLFFFYLWSFVLWAVYKPPKKHTEMRLNAGNALQHNAEFFSRSECWSINNGIFWMITFLWLLN